MSTMSIHIHRSCSNRSPGAFRTIRHGGRAQHFRNMGAERGGNLEFSEVGSGVAEGRGGMGESRENITILLNAAASGERGALDSLMAALYDDMRRLAADHMGGERNNHTLQPTALVHEAYVRLVQQHSTRWTDRVHFFAVASRIIRRILIDHARSHLSEKRGGPKTRIRLDDQDIAEPDREVDLLALDEALKELAEINEHQAKIVELRYFGGCTVEEVADMLKVGKRTLDRDWAAARAWLCDRLGADAAESSDDR